MHDPVALVFIVAGAALVVCAPRKNARAGRICLGIGTAIACIAMFLSMVGESLGLAVMTAAMWGCLLVLVTVRWTSILSVPGGEHRDITTIASWWAAALGAIGCMVVAVQAMAGRVPSWVGVAAVLIVAGVAVTMAYRDAAGDQTLASDQLAPFALATAGTLGVFAICYLPAFHARQLVRLQ